MRARDVIRILEADGWQEVRTKGSHKQFRHQTKHGTTTVPMHGGKDLSFDIIRSVERQSGLKLRSK